jgi:plasmid replication initiation protein
MSKTKDVVPTQDDYLLQAHAISRGAYTMTVLERRLVYLAMAQVRPADDTLPAVKMHMAEVCKALGMEADGRAYIDLRAAIHKLMERVIDIDTPDGGWVMYHWVHSARYNAEDNSLTIRLHDELAPYVLHMREQYTVLRVADLAKLQSKYSQRWVELVLSRRGQADGQGRWYYELTIAELRHILKIGPDEYKLTNTLRINVIELPIAEINASGIGLHLTPEYIRRGKYLHAVRMHCQLVGRDDPVPVHGQTAEEEAEDAYISAHQARYDEILNQIKAQPDLPGTSWASPTLREMAQRAEALKILRSETKTKRGRGRPRKEQP